ncbi:MAG: hypothetical protein Q4B36_05410 [Tissierellia bacterium]|nr:hypothetical protein [Tissierellia bacterium]
MNYIFLSPEFPDNYKIFVEKLRENGVNVLGIGECPYQELDVRLKSYMTEYYWVKEINYEEIFKAVAYFSFRYGKIDFLESINTYWKDTLEKVRVDFNIANKVYDSSNNTNEVICYDGLIDYDGNIVFEFESNYKKSPKELTSADIKESVKRKCIDAIRKRNIKSSFFHIEMDNDYNIISIEENYDIGFIFDIYNYAYDIDIYKAYADMIVKKEIDFYKKDIYDVLLLERENDNYKYTNDDIKDKYRDYLCMVLEGNKDYFIFRSKDKKIFSSIKKDLGETI